MATCRYILHAGVLCTLCVKLEAAFEIPLRMNGVQTTEISYAGGSRILARGGPAEF